MMTDVHKIHNVGHYKRRLSVSESIECLNLLIQEL